MGRRTPSDSNITLKGQFQFQYFSFSILGLVASILIISSLCTRRFRRKSSSSSQPCSKRSNNSDQLDLTKPLKSSSATIMEVTTSTTSPEEQPSTSETKEEIKELPLPPAMQQPAMKHPKENNMVKRATSERRLSLNLSMKMPRNLSLAKNWDQKEGNYNGGIGKKGKLKADESVWMKTIILGGKCVPDEEEDAVIYEKKGKKISAYHPKKSTSMSLPNQWSLIPNDELSVNQAQHPHEEEKISNI